MRVYLFIQSVCNINVSWQYETNAGSVFNHIINIQIFSRYDSDSCMNWKNISPDTVINIHTTSTRSKGTSSSIFLMFLQVIPILQSIIYLEASLLISLLIYWTGSSWDLVKCLCLSSVWLQLYSTEYLNKKKNDLQHKILAEIVVIRFSDKSFTYRFHPSDCASSCDCFRGTLWCSATTCLSFWRNSASLLTNRMQSKWFRAGESVYKKEFKRLDFICALILNTCVCVAVCLQH